jgi:hypothetical protein
MPSAAPAQPPAASTGSVHRLEFTYVSRGLNANKEWGTFQLFVGGGGKALYVLGKPVSASLEFQGVFPSVDSPSVSYRVYREAGGTRLWAFQIGHPTVNGYVIYTKAKGEVTDPAGWQFYDFAHKYPDWPMPLAGIPTLSAGTEFCAFVWEDPLRLGIS